MKEVVLFALFVFIVVGCASTGSIEEANQKIADLENRVSKLEKPQRCGISGSRGILNRGTNTVSSLYGAHHGLHDERSVLADGYRWGYSVENGTARIDCISPKPIGRMAIPPTLRGTPVTSIKFGAFEGCTGLTDVTIPNSVTNIGSGAFCDCIGLKSVMIPNGVVSIGNFSFRGCTGLTVVTIPDSVTSIGDDAFKGCTRLTAVVIPSNVTSIGKDAFDKTPFYNNKPDGMVILGSGVLYKYKGKCPSSVTIPSDVTGIGSGAFCMCRGLTFVMIPSSVTSIERWAFSSCDRLAEVIIPNSVTNIGSWAFKDCLCLTSIRIPSSVTSMGTGVFSDCSRLTSVTIPEEIEKKLNKCRPFCRCPNLKSIDVVTNGKVKSISFESPSSEFPLRPRTSR